MTDLQPHTRVDLDQVLREFLGELFQHQPVFATAMGDHRFDDRWPDVSASGLAELGESLRGWRKRFAGLDEGGFSADDRIDRDLLIEEIDKMLFDLEELHEERWDTLGYLYLAGAGLFTLIAREFAPLTDRMASFAGRVEGLPALLEAAADNLTGLPGRPVSLLHLETALGQLDGIGQLIDEATAALRAQLVTTPDDSLASGVLQRIEAADPAARAAIETFRRRLEEDIRPRAEGEGRLGGELYARKLRWALRSELSPADLLARAEHDHAAIRAEMLRLARQAWPGWLGDEAMPAAASAGSEAAADRETIRLVLDAVAREHPRVEELLDRCRAETAALELFITERRLLEAPDEPLDIIWTPLFLRSFGGGYMDAPGPLERGQKSFFGFTPPPDDATPEQVESLLREENDRMLKVLCIHETIPGHYLQLWYANRHGSLARAVFASGMFAEGWAVYVTQVLMDLGYADGDPALLLTHWKFYLRAVINTILDVRTHGGAGEPMDEAEAIRLMTEEGFQEEHEARAKWNRARLSSTQLSTYFVGSRELWDVELEARRRAASTAGDDGSLPQPRVVGGLGETTGFSYPEHLTAVLSHGTPPIHVLRRILFGAPTMSG
jgi:uncharacterized protein (DUF885 family)